MRRLDASPKFSVVVCTHNRGESLRRTCDALLRIREPPGGCEFLIVDNASTQRATFETIKAVVAVAPDRVRATREPCPGLSYARNRGIRAALGEIIAFLDDDALPDPNWLLSLAAAFDSTDAGIIGGRVYLRFRQPPPPWMRNGHHVYLSAFDLGDLPLWLHYDSYPRGTNLALRRAVIQRYGGFSGALGRKGIKLLSGEEIELCVRAERAGVRILYAPDAVVQHDVQSERLTTKWLRARLASQGRSEALIEWMHGGVPACLAGAWRLIGACLRASASSNSQPPVYRSALRRQLAGYVIGALSGMVTVPRVRSAFEPPLPRWHPRRLPPESAGRVGAQKNVAAPPCPMETVRVLGSFEPSRASRRPEISIIIPTRDGGSALEQCLAAVADQSDSRPREVICVDSSDESARADELVGKWKVRVIRIDPRTFDHGLARDLGAAHARGKILVFINQDIVPCDEFWLGRLTAPLEQTAIAAVQGGIRESPERDRRFYWDSCGERFYFTRESRAWLAAHGGIGLSTVNLALQRQAWRELPFGPAAIMEDKKWQAAAAARGFQIAHQPDAAVFHSHAYDLRSLARRCVSEGLGWSCLGQPYRLVDALRDMTQMTVHADLLRGLATREITGAGELLFPLARPLLLYYGNRWCNDVLL